MDERPSATIVLCQDIRTAMSWQKLLKESRRTDDLNVIISGHLFDDLSILPWSYFHGHDVVFVPAPDKQCMAMTKAYHAYVMGAGAKSFRVASYVLLHSKPDSDLNTSDRPELADAEKALTDRLIFSDDVERQAGVLKRWQTRLSLMKNLSNGGERSEYSNIPNRQLLSRNKDEILVYKFLT